MRMKLQYFGHIMRRVDSLEKTLMLGGIRDMRRRGQQRMRWLDGITDSMDVSLSEELTQSLHAFNPVFFYPITFALFNTQNFGILNFIHGFHENSWVLVLKSMFK